MAQRQEIAAVYAAAVIQGVVLVLGVTVVAVNAVVDLLLAALDPRQVSR